jgi:hypothetical protein
LSGKKNPKDYRSCLNWCKEDSGGGRAAMMLSKTECGKGKASASGGGDSLSGEVRGSSNLPSQAGSFGYVHSYEVLLISGLGDAAACVSEIQFYQLSCGWKMRVSGEIHSACRFLVKKHSVSESGPTLLSRRDQINGCIIFDIVKYIQR